MAKNGWSNYSTFFSRFNVGGFGKVVDELLSEGLTLGTAGFMLLLAFAIPAFEEINETWRTTGKYAVTFLDRYGNEIGQRGVLHSETVPLSEIPDVMIKATLATEDRRFYDHFGIDIFGTLRALVNNIQGESGTQGGSSISQQLAKNIFLSSEQTLARKIKEAFLAVWLETHLSKDDILQMYFDRAYMGGGTVGVEAATQYYFGKSIRDVTLPEAAVLAGLFKAPTKYSPNNNPGLSRQRTNDVLTNLVQAGFMTEGQVHGARLNPAQVKEQPERYTPDYFMDWAFEEAQLLMRGRNAFVLTAKTTVDMSLQRTAEEVIKSAVRKYGVSRHIGSGALVSMDTDGAVRAIVGGVDYERSQFNRATQSFRQPGSSIKPYVYLTAIQGGMKPGSKILDGPVSCGNWSPKNYSGGYHGWLPLAYALQRSLNTVAVRISNTYGREKIIANLKKVGIDHIKPTCSMALGDQGVTLLQHTSGYASFANGGMRAEPYGITEIRDSTSGEVLYSHERDAPKPKRVFDAQNISDLNSMLGRVVQPGGTAIGAALDFTTVAGKTGTTSSYRDAWFMGFSGQYVTGVWFGNDNYTPTNRVTGGSVPAEAWHDYMSRAHLNPDIPQIPGLPIHPNQLAYVRQLKEQRQADPSLGSEVSAVRGLSKKTEAALELIGKMMKDAKPLEAVGNRQRAALEPVVAPVQAVADSPAVTTTAPEAAATATPAGKQQ
jgi:penicillin-binding protein 1A